jgi:hypothetical protein
VITPTLVSSRGSKPSLSIMPSSVLHAEPHGIHKTLSIGESQQLAKYLQKKRTELELERSNRIQELQRYEQYFHAIMEQVDHTTAEGQAEVADIYRRWTQFKASFGTARDLTTSTSRPLVTVAPAAPFALPQSYASREVSSSCVNFTHATHGTHSGQPGGVDLPSQAHSASEPQSLKYPPGLFPVHAPPYVPLSPLFDEEPKSGAYRYNHPVEDYVSDSRSASLPAYPPFEQGRHEAPSVGGNHISFYTQQPHLAAEILTEEYKQTICAEGPDEVALAEAFSIYYVEQVVRTLLEPGHYRPGQGGSDEAIWGRVARNFAELTRVGRHVPDVAAPWGRMGMDAPRQAFPAAQPIHHANRLQNPYSLPLTFLERHGNELHAFAYRLIYHMKIPVVTVIAAIWYIKGLPLHDGDGLSGHQLRLLLRKTAKTDPQQAVKKVLVLGLVLAGKWLDDNAYHTKTWSELSGMTTLEIDKLELLGLGHYHFSLNLPGLAWMSHVNFLFNSMALRPADSYDQIIMYQLDHICVTARESELQLNSQIVRASATESVQHEYPDRSMVDAKPSYGLRRYDSIETQAHGDYSLHVSLEDDYDSGAEEVDRELVYEQERYVSALVDDDEQVDDEFDDGMSEFAEYDGAAPFITREHMRRSVSVSSSTMEVESIEQWRAQTSQSTSSAAVQPSSAWPSTLAPARRHKDQPEVQYHHDFSSSTGYHSLPPQAAMQTEDDQHGRSVSLAGATRLSHEHARPFVTRKGPILDIKGWEECPYFR